MTMKWSKLILVLAISVWAVPCPAVEDGYAVWSEPEGDDINIYISTLRDGAWDNARKITAGGKNLTPAVSADRDGSIWTVWVEFSGENRFLNYAKILDKELLQGRVLNTSEERSYSPSIIVDHTQTPWLSWASDSGTDEDIYYSRWNGSEWETPRQVNRDDGYPDITPTIGLRTNGKPWISWLGYNGDRYDTYTVYWIQNRWSQEQLAEIPNLVEHAAKKQISDIPELPAQSSKRLMGSVFIRDAGEIQSLSERIVPFTTRRGK